MDRGYCGVLICPCLKHTRVCNLMAKGKGLLIKRISAPSVFCSARLEIKFRGTATNKQCINSADSASSEFMFAF